MKKTYSILTFILILSVSIGFSQGIQLPDEEITGEDTRIEKTHIFSFPAPSFKVRLPELQTPEDFFLADNLLQKKAKGNVSFLFGSNNTAGTLFSYRSLTEGTEYKADIEGLLSHGHRDNSKTGSISFDFQRKSSSSAFSTGVLIGEMQLPGPENSPFPDRKRDFTSFNTEYSFTRNPDFIPLISKTFYRIDNSEEINFILLNSRINNGPFTFETGIERQDVFSDGFSSTAFYQSVNRTQGPLTIGGTLKVIERYGWKFLPSLTYNINDATSLNLSGTYQIPDLYKDMLGSEHKEITSHEFAPEEEYKLSLVFNKQFTNTDIRLDISPAYKERFYSWADTDTNGLLEPYPQRYWQTSINLIAQHKFTDYFTGYITGEKRFLSEEIEYYPEAIFDAGFVVNYKNFEWNNWVSYTGERSFSDKTLGSVPIFNSEITLQIKNIKWGIAVHNITDREYSSVPEYPAEKRSVLSFIQFFF